MPSSMSCSEMSKMGRPDAGMMHEESAIPIVLVCHDDSPGTHSPTIDRVPHPRQLCRGAGIAEHRCA